MGLTRRIKVDNTTIEYSPDQSLRVKDLRPRSVSMHHISASILPYAFPNMRSMQILNLYASVHGIPQATPALTWPADLSIRFWPFILRNTIQVNTMRVNIVTAGGVGNEMRMNLYDSNDDTYGTPIDHQYFGWPRIKLLATDWTFDTSTTGIKSITLSPPLTLTKGRVYWYALQNNNVGTKPDLNLDVWPHRLLLGIGSGFTESRHGLIYNSNVYQTLPSDISVSPGYGNLVVTATAYPPSLQFSFTFISI